jgi:hypothetical protein
VGVNSANIAIYHTVNHPPPVAGGGGVGEEEEEAGASRSWGSPTHCDAPKSPMPRQKVGVKKIGASRSNGESDYGCVAR